MQQLLHTDNYASIAKAKNSKLSRIVSRITVAEGEEKADVIVSLTGEYNIPDLILPTPPAPVYVTKDNGEDQIVYNSFAMEPGKMYEVDFKGERWALIRNEKDVEFLKFQPKK